MLFVSCQPYSDEDYYKKDFILSLCKAAKLGGASGLRIEGVENINYIRENIDLPIVGLIKNKINNRERYITANIEDIDKILRTKCDYIAIDYTLRDNLTNTYFIDITNHIHEKSDCKIIADISNISEAKNAKSCGVDYVSTTLRGYTNYTKQISLPDLDFIKKLRELKIENIIAEGGFSSHFEYIQALRNGAKIVTIGTAITRPHLIIKKILKGSF